MKLNRDFVVLGGAGAIGRVVVRDLFESNVKNQVLIADFNEKAAYDYAQTFQSRRVTSKFADGRQLANLSRLLRSHSVVINCTQHQFNLSVMQAALAAKVHYLDLGGLFYWTRRQLKLDASFKDAGLTAIPGMGCSPGITNVLARYAADRFERVDSIKIRVGSIDFNFQTSDLCFPYSAQTIVEELTLKPWVYTHGKFRQTAPRTGWEQVEFGKPIGSLWVVRTRHSEMATVPLSFRKKGIKHCDFKVSFERKFVHEIMRRLRGGATTQQFSSLPAPRKAPNDYEISRVIVAGKISGASKRTTLTVDCHARSKPSWQASAGDLDTGCPPSIVAQMLTTGLIIRPGVLAPEVAVPVEPFLTELKRRGMRCRVRRSNGVELHRTKGLLECLE